MSIWAIIGIVLIFVLLLSGAPIALAFGFGSLIVILLVMGMPVDGVASLVFNSINSFPLLACPFFILAGNLLLKSGGMPDVRDFMNSWLGQIKGGLASGAIFIGAFLGAVSGSSTACLAIMGTIVLPIMVDSGYDRPFSSAIALNAAELGWIIPPSLALIIFGALCRVSIPDLFLAGIGTGLFTAILMAIVALIISRRRKYPAAPKASWKARGTSFVRALPVIFMPVVVLGGIYGGLFSPTESATIACFYTLAIGLFFYRQLNWAAIKEALWESLKLSAMIYFLIVCADLFSKVLCYLMVPQTITEVVIGLRLEPLAFLLVIEGFLLVMGFFFSSIPMIIVILPMFVPIVLRLGIDPVFYGILAIMVTSIGEITPPMGPQLWFAEPICHEKMGNIMRESWPFLGAMTVAMVICTFVPDIAMFLVNLWR